MAVDDDSPDPKVKQLLASQSLDGAVDAATAAQLARWFTLPSFDQLAEQPLPPADDPETIAARERRDNAIAAVDRVWLERHRIRTEVAPESLLHPMSIELRVDPSFGLLDAAMIDRRHVIAEPREVEIPDQLKDDLKDCTEQALLRDLHRAEIDFDKTFEVVDMAAEQRFDIVAEVESVMTTDWKLPTLPLLSDEAKQLTAELRADRRRPWTDVLLLPLSNRRVSE